MAFGIKREELLCWKQKAASGEIAFLTHYWQHPRFPHIKTVTKVGCQDVQRLIQWGEQKGLRPEWIDWHEQFPHFDLIGDKQKQILIQEQLWGHIERFRL
jgi:hypothetical protein